MLFKYLVNCLAVFESLFSYSNLVQTYRSANQTIKLNTLTENCTAPTSKS